MPPAPGEPRSPLVREQHIGCEARLEAVAIPKRMDGDEAVGVSRRDLVQRHRRLRELQRDVRSAIAQRRPDVSRGHDLGHLSES